VLSAHPEKPKNATPTTKNAIIIALGAPLIIVLEHYLCRRFINLYPFSKIFNFISSN
jgi:hypothetical protein